MVIGICASSRIRGKGGVIMKWPATTMMVDLDGGLQEFRKPIRAGKILSQNRNCFLSSSETMFLGSPAPHVPNNEQLQLGTIYFLIPMSKSQTPLSLQDLCVLAIKASSALDNSLFWNKAGRFSGRFFRPVAEIRQALMQWRLVPIRSESFEFYDQQKLNGTSK